MDEENENWVTEQRKGYQSRGRDTCMECVSSEMQYGSIMHQYFMSFEILGTFIIKKEPKYGSIIVHSFLSNQNLFFLL